MIRTPNVGKGRLVLQNVHRVSESIYNERNERAIPSEDDIILAREAPVGNAAIIRTGQKVCLGQRVVLLRPNKSIVNPMFLVYYLLSDEIQHKLKNNANGAVVAHLNMNEIRNLSVSIPERNIQDKIASILCALDDKIEINRRINDNLEQQAQALFKSWFVDFEPFKDGEFVESELGMIPKEWKVVSANEVFEINIGKTPPRKESKWFSKSKEDNIWVSISDMGSCGVFISDSSEYLTDEAIKKFNIQMVKKDAILLSFKLTIGRVAIANKCLTSNEAIARFILPDVIYREFLYLYLKQYKYGNLGSTSSIATAVNSKTIKGMNLLIPNIEVISQFSNLVKNLFEKIRILQQESYSLTQQRDLLLPKLMSGELNQSDLTM